MKKIAYILLFMIAGMAMGQQAKSGTLDNIKIGIQTGNVSYLSKYFGKSLEVKVDTKEGLYSKNQAEFILKDFFKKFPPKSFKYIHQGNSPGGASYSIGTYTSVKGTFRVYFNLKKSDSGFQLTTLEFTREN